MRPSSHRPEINDVRQLRTATAVVVLVDAHSAVIARCADGVLTRVRSVSAPRPHGASDHMGDWPRNSFHPGTRGETATDAAQRARASARREFVHRLAPIIAHATAATELIVVGGSRLVANALGDALAGSQGRRAIVTDNLHRVLSSEEVVARVTATVGAYLAKQDLADVRTLLERTGAHTTGVVGPMASLDAAEHGAVDGVLMTQRYQSQRADEAERIISATRAQNGRVVVVGGRAADLLDAHAGGVGALLRFALHKIPAEVGERTA